MMAIPHAVAGEVIDVGPLGSNLESNHTRTLIKTHDLEVIRLVLPKGKSIATHSAPCEITVHCIEGQATLATSGKSAVLSAGTMLYLNAGEPHSVLASESSTLLVTMVLAAKGK
jgi:quercetin dioxygenase-like cupin family protein